MTVAYCWRIQRRDGVTLGFTNHDRDLTIDGLLYRSDVGFSPTNLAADSDLQANNLELASVLDDTAINLTDLRTGAYDYARVLIFLCNYLDLPSSLSLNPPKHLVLLSGVMGKVSYTDGDYTAEVMSLARFLEHKSGWVTSPTCRYDFGDSDCGVDLADWTQSLEVYWGRNAYTIESSNPAADDLFTGGRLTWTSGPNVGISVGIIKQLGRTMWFAVPMPNVPQAGETFQAIPNCAKTKDACRAYNNYLNFGGEQLPGLDAYYSSEEQ